MGGVIHLLLSNINGDTQVQRRSVGTVYGQTVHRTRRISSGRQRYLYSLYGRNFSKTGAITSCLEPPCSASVQSLFSLDQYSIFNGGPTALGTQWIISGKARARYSCKALSMSHPPNIKSHPCLVGAASMISMS
jgi:predicted membrane metal-binding protein